MGRPEGRTDGESFRLPLQDLYETAQTNLRRFEQAIEDHEKALERAAGELLDSVIKLVKNFRLQREQRIRAIQDLHKEMEQAVEQYRERVQSLPAEPQAEQASDTAPDEEKPVLEEKSRDVPQVKIHFNCPKCGVRLIAPELAAGKTSRCKSCDATVPIPPAEPPLRQKGMKQEGSLKKTLNSASLAGAPPREHSGGRQDGPGQDAKHEQGPRKGQRIDSPPSAAPAAGVSEPVTTVPVPPAKARGRDPSPAPAGPPEGAAQAPALAPPADPFEAARKEAPRIEGTACTLHFRCEGQWAPVAKVLQALQRCCDNFGSLSIPPKEEDRLSALGTYIDSIVTYVSDLDQWLKRKDRDGRELPGPQNSDIQQQIRDLRDRLFTLARQCGSVDYQPVKEKDPSESSLPGPLKKLHAPATRGELNTIVEILHPGYGRFKEGKFDPIVPAVVYVARQ